MEKSISQKGQSLVELALTITILLTLLAGAFDIGNAFLNFIAMRDAAQEGAVYASIFPTVGSANNSQDTNPNISNIIARVKTSSTIPLNFSSPSFSSTNCDGSSDNSICVEFPDILPCSGNTVKVTVHYKYKLIVPFVGGFLGTQDIPLSASVTNEILTISCDDF